MIYNPISLEEFKIYDIYHNTSGHIIIISPWDSKTLDIKYKNRKLDTKSCPHKHTIVYELKEKISYTDIIELSINDKIISTRVNKYPDFKDEIIMSTMVYNEDNYVRQWIEFHLNIGVSRFIIYDNSKIDDNKSYKSVEKTSDLKKVLGDFIEKGIVVLFEWSYPKRLTKSGISGQTTQQTHSIHAFRNSKYIGLFDIDEYVNIQTDDTNINSFLDKLILSLSKKINTDDIGSFRLLNKFFFNPDDLPTTSYNFLKIYNCEKVTLHGREKGFVIPKNVSTYSVHMITLGKQMFTIHPKLIYFNHYFFLNKKDRGKDKTNLKDTSIKRHTKFIELKNL